jgi:hypothetical protein
LRAIFEVGAQTGTAAFRPAVKDGTEPGLEAFEPSSEATREFSTERGANGKAYSARPIMIS